MVAYSGGSRGPLDELKVCYSGFDEGATLVAGWDLINVGLS